VKQVTVAAVHELTRALELHLDDEELAHLAPMVEDLQAVAQRLRHYQVDVGTKPDLTPARPPRPGD